MGQENALEALIRSEQMSGDARRVVLTVIVCCWGARVAGIGIQGV